MRVYIPNMEKPKDCSYCILANKHINGLCEAKYYCRLEADSCPLIEIVRCGECTEWHEYARQNLGRNLGRCDCWFITTGDDDFCSYGEREDE